MGPEVGWRATIAMLLMFAAIRSAAAAIDMERLQDIFSMSALVGWGLTLVAIFLGGLFRTLWIYFDDRHVVVNHMRVFLRDTFCAIIAGVPVAAFAKGRMDDPVAFLLVCGITGFFAAQIIEAIIKHSPAIIDEAIVVGAGWVLKRPRRPQIPDDPGPPIDPVATSGSTGGPNVGS